MMRHFVVWWACVLCALLMFFAQRVLGAGLFNDGVDARTISLGGVSATQSGSAIAALDSNPAALTTLPAADVEASVFGAIVRAKFEQPDGATSHLRIDSADVPAFGASIRIPSSLPIAVGVGFIPDAALKAEWRYPDSLGGLGGATSYGEQNQRSEILALRSTLGVSLGLTNWCSLGVSAGAIYNENELHAPYVFQSQPVLAGFKTLLDLEADGWGPSVTVGAQFRPASTLSLGVSYRTSTTIHTDGHASGNANAQLQSLGGAFAQVDPSFHYDAEVRTKFPQVIATAAEWQAASWLRLAGGVDWINWSDAFDRLEINLTQGSNAAVNSVVGSDAMLDVIPLHWRDQFVFRGGVECALGRGFSARAGYSHARSVAPPETLTPLSAAIFEDKVSTGVGYKAGRFHADFAWQYSLPVTERVGTSALLAGEYRNTSVRLSEHLLSLTSGVEF